MIEKKYIDAEAFILLAKERYPRFCPPDFADGYFDVLRQLEDAPVADVQEVKHGRWRQIGEKIGECSACGNKISTHGADHTGRALILTTIYKYCPNCGAKMDGGTDDET